MGQYVHLNINFGQISDKEWEKTYNETLTILKNFPFKLTTLNLEKKYGVERYTYSNNFIHCENTENELWDINGDLISDERGENYQIYRNRNKFYFGEIKEQQDFHDILWVKEKDIDYPSSSFEGVDVFGNKTQGAPFQLAVVAVGILIENSYPGNAYLWGDISKEEVENILPWLQKQTDVLLKIPVCFDADRLLRRLDHCYNDKEQVVDRFETLYIGTKKEKFKALFEIIDEKYIIKTYLNNDVIGIESILLQLFDIKQDVKELIYFVKRVNSLQNKDKERFLNKELLKILSSSFITISFKDRESMRALSSSKKNKNIEEIRDLILSGMFFLPQELNFYIAIDELKYLFLENTELKEEEIINIIIENEDQCYDYIEKCKECIKETQGKMENEEDIKELKVKSYVPEKISNEISNEELIFLEVAYEQKICFKDINKSVSILGKNLEKLVAENDEYFWEKNNRERLLKSISQNTFFNDFGLRSTAWENIDNEIDIRKLQYLVILTMVGDTGLDFSKTRNYIMENPATWDYLSQEKAV